MRHQWSLWRSCGANQLMNPGEVKMGTLLKWIVLTVVTFGAYPVYRVLRALFGSKQYAPETREERIARHAVQGATDRQRSFLESLIGEEHEAANALGISDMDPWGTSMSIAEASKLIDFIQFQATDGHLSRKRRQWLSEWLRRHGT